jgi:hypothetical protein
MRDATDVTSDVGGSVRIIASILVELSVRDVDDFMRAYSIAIVLVFP